MTIEKPKRAVFIDRDGTINPDSGFISRPEDFNIYSFTAEAIKLFNANGLYTFIVTNQSGIARGLITFDQIELIHRKMRQQLAENDAFIDEIFVAPYHKEGSTPPYNIDHIDRKPGLGMFQQAKERFDFSAKDSFIIGDRYSDILFGKKAGLKTVLVRTGEGDNEYLNNRHKRSEKPGFVVKDLLAAARFIVSL